MLVFIYKNKNKNKYSKRNDDGGLKSSEAWTDHVLELPQQEKVFEQKNDDLQQFQNNRINLVYIVSSSYR